MKYLLDVNVLVALGFENHEHHKRVAQWLETETGPIVATCSITELGFVRVLSQTPTYGYALSQARDLLIQLKKNRAYPIEFFPDGNDISHLPSWVKTGKQTTDGHLLDLAIVHGATLATLDVKIPGAFLLP